MSKLASVVLGFVLVVAAQINAHAGELTTGRFGVMLDGKEYPNADAACRARLRQLSPPERLKLPYPPDEFGNIRCTGVGSTEDNGFDQVMNGVTYSLICPPGTSEISTDRRSDPRRCKCEQDQPCPSPAAAPAPGPWTVANAVPPPAERGMTATDDGVFRRLAKERELIFLVRDSNPASTRFVGKPDYAPKPEALKAKSISADDPFNNVNAGLAAANPKDKRMQKMLADDKITYAQYVDRLKAKGFKVGPAPDYLVSNEAGTKFYSDIDLHGVYDLQGHQRWKRDLIEVLNARLTDDLIQHGPQDCWVERNLPSAGQNAGPQPPVTVYFPDGSTRWVREKEDMKRFYAEMKLPWPYAKDAKANWCD